MASIVKTLLLAIGLLLGTLGITPSAHALIRSAHSASHCWDAEGGTVRNGAKIILWHCHNRGNQQIWLDFKGDHFQANDGNTYRHAVIRFAGSNHCVDAASLEVRDGTQCQQALTRSFGGNRYTIQQVGGVGDNSRCAMSTVNSEFSHIIPGDRVFMSECRKGGLRGDVLQYWFVEQ